MNVGAFVWTNHVKAKMKFYRLSESRVKRVVRHPLRIEEGIAPNTVACMQRNDGTKRKEELWIMYQTKSKLGKWVVRVISAWRYPGTSPKRNPIPQEILSEVSSLLEFEE